MKKWTNLLLIVLSFAFITSANAQLTRQDQTIYGKKTFAHDVKFKKNLTLEGALLGVNQYSTVYWVDSVTGNDGGGFGSTYLKPFATVDYAINQCTANKGNVIYVMPGHAETIAAANGFDADVAGISIIGLGNGADMPEFSFTTTASTVGVGADGVTLSGLRFVAAVHAIVSGVSVEGTADNFTMQYCEFPEPTTGTYDFVIAIALAAGADSAKIIGNTYFHADAVGPASFIDMTAGVNNNTQIIDNYVFGEFSAACIYSNQADLETVIKGGSYTNMTTGVHALEFSAAATGFIDDVLLRTDTQATTVDPGSMTVGPNVYWDDEDTADSIAIPVILASAGPASIGTIDATTTDSIHGKIGTDTQMADSSLYDLIPNSANSASWNATALTAIEGEVQDALQAENLDHLTITTTVAADADLTTYAADLSLLSHIMTAGADTSDYLASTDSLEAIRDRIDSLNTADQADLDAILADTITISGGALPTVVTANSLGAFIASGGTQLGTELADSKSIVDAIGTDGTTVADTATGIAGMIGVNDADNAMDTSTVVSNPNGSVYERQEALQIAAAPTKDHPNYIYLSVDLSSATWNTVDSHEILTVTGDIALKIMVECSSGVSTAAESGTIELGTPGNTAEMIAQLAAVGIDTDEIWTGATPDAECVALSSAIREFAVINGKDVGYTIAGEAIVSGTLNFHMWWYPLDSTGAATVGAGEPLS